MKTLSRSASGESIVELGDWSFSHQYQCCRNPDRDLIINSTDALVHCFSNHFGPLVLGRNVGLLLMNKLAPIKHYFARRAMGY
jgi:2-octaprenyl-6-methoxyphenol hydroxylase